MESWMIFLIIAIVAIVFEIFAPTMFCINFAFAGVVAAILSVFFKLSLTALFVIFAVVALFSIVFIKPLLVKMLKKDDKTDFKSQYIGKVVKTIEPVNKTSGAVTIYDERWEARLSTEGEEIPAETDVKIVGNDSLILYVEKI